MQLKNTVKDKRKVYSIKLSAREAKLIQKKADQYTGGIKAEWIRYAAIELAPRAKDLARK